MFSLLFGQPERTFATSELIALAGSGSGAVQRELQRLVDSKLVTSIVAGRQKRYRANSAAPIFEELRSIVEKTAGSGAATPTQRAARGVQGPWATPDQQG